MARYRDNELQLLIGTLAETTVGEPRSDQVFTRLMCQFKRIPRVQADMERPDAKQEFGHEDRLAGNSDGKFSFDTFLYSKGPSGTNAKCAQLIKWLMGRQHSVGGWDETLNPSVSDGTMSSFKATTGVISESDIGALCVVESAGALYPAVIKDITIGDPKDTISVTPEAPDVIEGMRALKTFYFDGHVYHNTFPMRQADPSDDILDMLGGNISGKFLIEPLGKEPYVKFSAECSFTNQDDAPTDSEGDPVVYAVEDEDNNNPIALSAGCDAVLNGYTLTVRDDTRSAVTTLDFGTIEFDVGWNLQAIPNGRRRSGIGGWEPQMGDGSLKGSFTVPWNEDYYTAWKAGAKKHLIVMCGTNIVQGLFIIYWPHIIFGKSEDATQGGEKYLKVPFYAKAPRDLYGDSALERSPFVIGFLK